MALQSRIFSILFAVLAIAEFIGFLTGKSWCLYAAILLGALSLLLHIDYKKQKSLEDYNS